MEWEVEDERPSSIKQSSRSVLEESKIDSYLGQDRNVLHEIEGVM